MSNQVNIRVSNDDRVFLNDMGISQAIDTLTYVSGKLVEQKFYEIPFADYVPTVFGEGAFSDEMIYYTNFADSEGFDTGIISNGGRSASLEEVDTHYEKISVTPFFWGKQTTYSVVELQQAMKVKNLPSLIERREKVRYKEWQLGLQKTAFLGANGSTGLLNNAGITVNTTILTNFIKDLSTANLNTFAGALIGTYLSATNGIIFPDTLVIPQGDFAGLGASTDATYPIKTRLAFLQEAFALATHNPNFKILPCFYCDKANFNGTNNRYVLYNRSEEHMIFNINVDYTVTQFASTNNFNFASAGYGQVTPLALLRPSTVFYFGHNQ